MAAEVTFDVLEHILVGVDDVKDLIRCKSVCKSWYSFISSPRFVKAHMKHDRENVGYRRIGLNYSPSFDTHCFCCISMYVVGSCNGLVCVSPTDVELDVINPWTREIMKLPTPLHEPHEILVFIRQVVILGFGYDACSDDYKVIAGFRNRLFEERTFFYMLALKSNVWKFIGEVRYTSFWNRSGIFSGGALHWFMRAGDKKVIMSVDLSTEEFKEIPQPAGPEYERAGFYDHRLGVIEECLCVYFSGNEWVMINNIREHHKIERIIWVMKNNKWELYNKEGKSDDVAHCMICREVGDSENYSYVYAHDDGRLVPRTGDHMCVSMFVKSLVSPHPKV